MYCNVNKSRLANDFLIAKTGQKKTAGNCFDLSFFYICARNTSSCNLVQHFCGVSFIHLKVTHELILLGFSFRLPVRRSICHFLLVQKDDKPHPIKSVPVMCSRCICIFAGVLSDIVLCHVNTCCFV